VSALEAKEIIIRERSSHSDPQNSESKVNTARVSKIEAIPRIYRVSRRVSRRSLEDAKIRSKRTNLEHHLPLLFELWIPEP